MKRIVERATTFFDLPLELSSRILVLVAALAILPTLFLPLWNMTLFSNQFPDGLELNIYSYKLEGAKTENRDDLREINSLNHYIGMHPLREEDFTEFKWIPFVVGALGLVFLRCALIGNISSLVDIFVLYVYFGLFSLWSFGYKLYNYGHNLAPTAPVKVAPFMPPLFGHRKLANFDVYSYPSPGAYALAAVALVLAAAMILAGREERAEERSEEAVVAG